MTASVGRIGLRRLGSHVGLTVARATAFAAVEAGAAACIRTQDEALQGAPLAARLLVTAFIVVWAFEAHSRISFRGRRPRGDRLAAVLLFSALSWACLCLQSLSRDMGEAFALCAWIGLALARFAVADAFVWAPAEGARAAR